MCVGTAYLRLVKLDDKWYGTVLALTVLLLLLELPLLHQFGRVSGCVCGQTKVGSQARKVCRIKMSRKKMWCHFTSFRCSLHILIF